MSDRHTAENDAPGVRRIKACRCRCHGGHVGTGCRQNWCEKCDIPPVRGEA